MQDLALKFYVKMQGLRSALKNEDGQDMVEYAIVLGLIALGATATMKRWPPPSVAASPPSAPKLRRTPADSWRGGCFRGIGSSNRTVMNSVVWWATVSLVLVAAVWDVRTRRIPNRLVLPFLVAGLAFSTARYGSRGSREASKGSVWRWLRSESSAGSVAWGWEI